MPGTVEKWKWKLEGWWSVVGFGLAMLWERGMPGECGELTWAVMKV